MPEQREPGDREPSDGMPEGEAPGPDGDLEQGDRGDRGRPPGLRNPVRYSALVGLVFIGVIVFAAINTFGGDTDRILGASEQQIGRPLAMFAVPDIRSGLEGDANIDQTDCEVEAIPCPAGRERPAACEIEVEGAIRVCDLFDRPLVMSWWFTRGGDCLPTQDLVDRAHRRFEGRVNFLSVNVRDDRETVLEVVESRSWEIPVGWDRDGEASNLYRVGVCPTVAFALPGGILERVMIGSRELTREALDEAIEDLIAASREAQRRAGGF